MKYFTNKFIYLAVLFTSISALAESNLKQIPTGTIFNFDSGGSSTKFKILDMDGVFIKQERIRDGGSRLTEMIGFGVNLGSQKSETMNESSRKKVASLFPLKVGNKVEFDHNGITNGSQWTASDKSEIITDESITVPAGTFQTFAIQTDIYSGKYYGQTTCWYAISIGYCVKIKVKERGASDIIYELVSITAP